MVTFVLLVVVLGGMIFAHELGHFLVARLFNIEVEEFGFGLPLLPRIATLFTWHGTEFTLYPIPLGGFVRPKGENDPAIPDGLAAANPWKRLAVLFAGPLMNLLTAVVVASIMIAQTGISVPGKLVIRDVTANSPASQAGLRDNDVIQSIQGQPATDRDAAIALIRANLDKPVVLVVERNGQQVAITATPLSTRSVQEGALGIALGYPTRPASLSESI
jgi:regulator of sigma E protease